MTVHLHLAPRLKKEKSYTSTPLLGLRGLLYGKLYLYDFDLPVVERRVPSDVCAKLHNRTTCLHRHNPPTVALGGNLFYPQI